MGYEHLADRQAEPVAVALLGGEKGIEDAGEHIIAHPDSGILHLDNGAGLTARALGIIAAQGQRAAAGHRIDRVHHEVDQNLLELGSVDPHFAARPIVAHDGDRRSFEQVLDKREGVGDHRRNVLPILIAGIFRRSGELQKLPHDFADAPDLLVDQPELEVEIVGSAGQHRPDDLQIALHHRERIVDFMRDAGADLAERCELLRQDELFCGIFDLLARRDQMLGSFFDAPIEFVVPCAKLPIAILNFIKKAIEMLGHHADFTRIAARSGSRGEIAGFDLRDGRRHSLERFEDIARPAQE